MNSAADFDQVRAGVRIRGRTRLGNVLKDTVCWKKMVDGPAQFSKPCPVYEVHVHDHGWRSRICFRLSARWGKPSADHIRSRAEREPSSGQKANKPSKPVHWASTSSTWWTKVCAVNVAHAGCLVLPDHSHALAQKKGINTISGCRKTRPGRWNTLACLAFLFPGCDHGAT